MWKVNYPRGVSACGYQCVRGETTPGVSVQQSKPPAACDLLKNQPPLARAAHLGCHHALRFGPERARLLCNELGLLAEGLQLLTLAHNLRHTATWCLVCVCACVHQCVCACVHLWVSVGVSEYVCACVFVSVCVCVHV